ncbi:hypothetical protein QQS21_007432 [Conoideocrella luteorostrata]|uniref:Uncharacterized protein n=1 Tax=Conoideocrella luteorostrata TaxID=1105319 RepID=A0AAJ0CKP3_9HYPO|nr:hypothetical protein QQS21_007432 [Conoideocrella luteorostrata]
MTSNNIPDPQRFITASDESGESYFSNAEAISLSAAGTLGSAKTRLAYTSDGQISEGMLKGGHDLQRYQAELSGDAPLVRSDGGTNVWVIDTPPASKSPLHSTASLDYVIQVSGTIELSMSNGDTRTLYPGDIAIQRGTLHVWSNPSTTEWSRLVGVMTGMGEQRG